MNTKTTILRTSQRNPYVRTFFCVREYGQLYRACRSKKVFTNVMRILCLRNASWIPKQHSYELHIEILTYERFFVFVNTATETWNKPLNPGFYIVLLRIYRAVLYPHWLWDHHPHKWHRKTTLSKFCSSFCNSLHFYRERIVLIPSSALLWSGTPHQRPCFLLFLAFDTPDRVGLVAASSPGIVVPVGPPFLWLPTFSFFLLLPRSPILTWDKTANRNFVRIAHS